MIKAKTMTHWENEDYDYPLPDVSRLSKKEAEQLKMKGVEFVVFGHRNQIKTDEEFENCIALEAQWNWSHIAEKSKKEYEEIVMTEVKSNRFLWYHGRGRVNQQVQHYEIFLKKTSAGVKKLSFSLGLALIFFLILAIFPSVTVLMSVPLGIYCLTSLLAFSMAPFCHAQ